MSGSQPQVVNRVSHVGLKVEVTARNWVEGNVVPTYQPRSPLTDLYSFPSVRTTQNEVYIFFERTPSL